MKNLTILDKLSARDFIDILNSRIEPFVLSMYVVCLSLLLPSILFYFRFCSTFTSQLIFDNFVKFGFTYYLFIIMYGYLSSFYFISKTYGK